MGRIAEALKKAQREREEQIRLGLGESPAVGRTLIDASESAADVRIAGAETADHVRLASVVPATSSNVPLRGLRTSSRTRRGSTPLTALPSWDVHHSVVALNDRSSSTAEQYRAVRTWLLRRNNASERVCYALTSSVPREGKSVTTANLAVTMAEVRHLNVLVVDSDFRQGSISRLYKLPNEPGLAGVLSGRATLDEAVIQTPISNLSVLPAGNCRDLNSTELLNSSSASRLFDEIRERFNFVFVDTPPVQKLSDVGVVGALCTGILMVVRMHKTPSNLVRQSIHWLQSNNLDVIGCIAAGCSLQDSRHMYREAYAESP